PDFSVGAMENWGLMTFREQTMLVDPQTGSIESKQLVAIVVCHELSHQWFGNLVTMKWWDDLWLNESFANLMEYVGVHGLYPEWQIWEQFVSMDVASAKRRDSLLDVQTIKTAVNHPDEIETLFDPSIVYAKGGTILRMLLTYVGEDAFRRGLKLYFDKHQYSNTEANDLWEALSQASGQAIADFMEGWLTRPGYPLIDIDWQPGEKIVSLKQQRFISNPGLQAPPSKPWQVPLVASAQLDEPLLKTTSLRTALKPNENQPVIFNHEGSSYYLPYYRNHEHLQSIVQGIHDDKVGTLDRLLLLDNYTLLQRGGQAETTDLLDLLKGYEGESSENVWGAMSVALGEARKLTEDDEACEDKLNQLIASFATPLATKLGWDDESTDSAQTLRLRGLAIALTAGAKVQAILDEGIGRFRACQKAADLPASTRGTVYFIASRHGEPKDFAKLLKMYHSADSADEREEIAGGLSSTKRPKDTATLLDMFTTNDIRRQDLMHWYIWMLRNRYSREATWQWLVNNWDWAEREMSSDKTFSYFARYAGSVFSRPDELKKFQAFFEPKKTAVSLAHDITLATEEINARIAWRERNEATVKAWLKNYS
ncbi:MAG TPA: M1 family aminopeptidase, partial [Verrucomicrobiae bacterium]|nr:M1 family aminopeptidase [Verrucomicrobiae bacterium]